MQQIKRIAYWRGKANASDLELLADVSNKTARTWLSEVVELDTDLESQKSGSTISSVFLKKEANFKASSNDALSALYGSYVLDLPAQSALPNIPFNITTQLDNGVDNDVFYRLVNALSKGVDFTITYVGMRLNESARDRKISPAKLIWIDGRWHLQAVDKENRAIKDFVLSRILAVFDEIERKDDFSELITEQDELVQLRVKPHHRLTAEQAIVVARQFGISVEGSILTIPRHQEWYVKHRWVAGMFDMPPDKLLELY